MLESAPVVCSFHTPDQYYTEHAQRLRANLDRLGIEHDIRQVDKGEDEDWADVCRRKIAFLNEVCLAHPGRRVFWIDVDCQLLSLPEWVRDFSADLVGFQRGFGTPLRIGYERRTRFWEPCFFGISPSERGRRFIADAADLERVSTLKATDDYFFEEAWRANAARMSFQVIPSTAVVGNVSADPFGERPFFAFGSSGNVEEFKGKVVQHERSELARGPRLATRVRRAGLAAAKRTERALPASTARSLRRVADAVGVTGALTGGTFGDRGGLAGAGGPARQAAVGTMIARAQQGDEEGMRAQRALLASQGVMTDAERSAVRAAEAFAHHATTGTGQPVPLAWWPRPFPGNFGDWLSPLIVAHATGRPVHFQPPTAKSTRPHLMGLGSIGRFAKRSSTVVGTGVSTLDVELAPKATWVSVRGPLTAQALRSNGGPDVERFGDPGVLVRRAIPLTRGSTNGRVALVRHYSHLAAPLDLGDGIDELSVLASHPEDLQDFLTRLIAYDRVITSAMHVMIACHSYGIPCALVTFEGLEDKVYGSGIKYEDYALGVGVTGIREPARVGWDLTAQPWDDLTLEVRLADAVLDDVAAALAQGVASMEGRLVP